MGYSESHEPVCSDTEAPESLAVRAFGRLLLVVGCGQQRKAFFLLDAAVRQLCPTALATLQIPHLRERMLARWFWGGAVIVLVLMNVRV